MPTFDPNEVNSVALIEIDYFGAPGLEVFRTILLRDDPDTIIQDKQGKPVIFVKKSAIFKAYGFVPKQFLGKKTHPPTEPMEKIHLPAALSVLLEKRENDSANLLEAINFCIDIDKQFNFGASHDTVKKIGDLADILTFSYEIPECHFRDKYEFSQFLIVSMSSLISRATILWE